MTNPSGNISIDPDQTHSAAAEMQACVDEMEQLRSQLGKLCESFKADAQVDQEIMPAADTTMGALDTAVNQIQENLATVGTTVTGAHDTLNGVTAEQQQTDVDTKNTMDNL